MPCFHPIPAEDDGSNVVLHPSKGAQNLSLPCGNCIGCKVARAQEWAARCMHELREHHSAIFATLTYSEKWLPPSGSLVPDDLMLFHKRLRKAMYEGEAWLSVNESGAFAGRLRYVACGEYGDVGGRPHYHSILFGLGCNDKVRATSKLFNSPELERVWGLGAVKFGEVTHASCAYVAGYTAKSFGRSYCDSDGVVLERPFLRCSKGIGSEYVRRYADDFRSGALVVDGVARKIPRYYRQKLSEWRPDVSQELEYNLKDRYSELNEERLVAGEVIAKRGAELTRSHSL